jgi:hydroxymethylglutaryl-CoA synthase
VVSILGWEKTMKDGAILDLAVAIPRHYLQHDDLAAARGVDPDKYKFGLKCQEMSVCGPGEDTVSLAAEAGHRLLMNNPGLRERVGLCIVGTESSVDGSKPVAVYVHRLLDLPATCRAFEIKHACYGATAGLQMARTWTMANPDRVALVIAADIARYERFSAGEPTQGAGAVAMAVGMATEEEACLTLSHASGIHANEVSDFWRPNYRSTACVRGKFSMDCYLDGMIAAYEDYTSQTGDHDEPAYLLYHLPFPNMARKGHRRLMTYLGRTNEIAQAADFETRVMPTMWANQRIGNIYTGSLYLALAGLCEARGEFLKGRKVALFSYGSGSCSEYFTARFGQRIAKPQLQALLASRQKVDVPTYERLIDGALAMEKDISYQPDLPASRKPFTYLGIRDHERIYRKNEGVIELHTKLPKAESPDSEQGAGSEQHIVYLTPSVAP